MKHRSFYTKPVKAPKPTPLSIADKVKCDMPKYKANVVGMLLEDIVTGFYYPVMSHLSNRQGSMMLSQLPSLSSLLRS